MFDAKKNDMSTGYKILEKDRLYFLTFKTDCEKRMIIYDETVKIF